MPQGFRTISIDTATEAQAAIEWWGKIRQYTRDKIRAYFEVPFFQVQADAATLIGRLSRGPSYQNLRRDEMHETVTCGCCGQEKPAEKKSYTILKQFNIGAIEIGERRYHDGIFIGFSDGRSLVLTPVEWEAFKSVIGQLECESPEK